jgi:hypothetical protein
MRVVGSQGMVGGFLLNKDDGIEVSGRWGYIPIQGKDAPDGVRAFMQLEIFVVADGHSGWGFDGFRRNEFCGIAFELVDAVDESGAMNGFGGVGEWGCGGPLFEEIVDVRTGDGAGLTGGCGVDCQCEHGFESAEFNSTLDLGGHGVAAFGSLGYGFGDGFEDATQRG